MAKQQCESYWDRGHTRRCRWKLGHKGLHESKQTKRLPYVAWRLDWEDTAIGKREEEAKRRAKKGEK